jgi:hypothetical protein
MDIRELTQRRQGSNEPGQSMKFSLATSVGRSPSHESKGSAASQKTI